MAVAMLLLVLLSLAAVTVKSAPFAPAALMTCTENGYYATVTLGPAPPGTTESSKITVGDGSGGCVVDNSDIGAGGANEAVGASGTPMTYDTCGVSSTSTDADEIIYEVPMVVVITETVDSLITRSYKYQFDIKCTLTRVQTEAGTVTFTVDSTLVLEDAPVPKDDTFDLDITLDFLDSSNQPQPSTFSVSNNEMLELKVAETTPNAALKFTVQKCFASSSDDATVTTATYDLLLDECPQDDTISFTPATDPQEVFTFQMRAFYMSGSVDGAVYVHCELFICETAETDDDGDATSNSKCVQNTIGDCSGSRKRRSIEDSRKPLITSAKQHFQVVLSAVRCPHNYVFDSSIDECTNERLLLIKGLYLDIEWNERYGNASSHAFKDFARVTGSYLESLINIANKNDVIKGLKIVQARKGSVILDVLITYAESVDAGEAFQIFEDVMYKTTPQMTRVVNFLNIRHDKIIEYVPVMNNGTINMEMILVIVIVAAVIVISFISGISLYKVRLGRSQASPPATINNSFDNKAMENI